MEIVLPITKLVHLEGTMGDVVVAVCFHEVSVTGESLWRTEILVFEDRVVDMPKGLIAASSSRTVLLGSQEGLLDVVLVAKVTPLEQQFSDLEQQFVPVFTGNEVNVVEDLLYEAILQNPTFFPNLYLQVRRVDLQLAHPSTK